MLVKQISWADDGAKLENMHAEIEGNKHRVINNIGTSPPSSHLPRNDGNIRRISPLRD